MYSDAHMHLASQPPDKVNDLIKQAIKEGLVLMQTWGENLDSSAVGIVDGANQGKGWASTLKPIMGTAINLKQHSFLGVTFTTAPAFRRAPPLRALYTGS